MNTSKTKIMIFRKGGRLRNNLNFLYKNSQIKIVKKPLKLNWALSVKELLYKLGFMQALLFQGDGNEKDLLKCLKQGLKIFLCKIGMHDWKHQLELDFTILLQIFVIRIIWMTKMLKGSEQV